MIAFVVSLVHKGMLPNRFPDDGSAPEESDYNNVDGTVREKLEVQTTGFFF